MFKQLATKVQLNNTGDTMIQEDENTLECIDKETLVNVLNSFIEGLIDGEDLQNYEDYQNRFDVFQLGESYEDIRLSATILEVLEEYFTYMNKDVVRIKLGKIISELTGKAVVNKGIAYTKEAYQATLWHPGSFPKWRTYM